MLSSRWRQRVLATGAALALVLGLTSWPLPGRVGDESAAALPDGPYVCGPNDVNRRPLTLSSGGGTIRPCLSGVDLQVTIPDNTSNVRYAINKIRSVDTNNLVDANGTVMTDLVHISFDSFVIGQNTSGAAVPVSGVTLATTNGNGYTLNLSPDAGVTLGGPGVTTDLWVTEDSWVRVNDNMLGLGCLVLTISGNPCKLTVGTFSSLSWLLNGSSYNGYGMELHVKYLVTYKTGGGVPTGSSVQLPNTSMAIS
ncbi:hypothetical protein EFK50_03615 [Nocardioides marmoriginsengisoli]|uniref:Uncharacterized protein n=1 Tax=Nocardioides marmoriginsengisoli TaxID=661483 RepID=A0A3N0CNL6_9ACTN|nr:hypothetical protein EFK50_03615 [Nocardioides marmoriginsengisoli]